MFLKRHAIALLFGLCGCADGRPDPGAAEATYGATPFGLTTAEYPPAKWIASPNFVAMSRKPPDVQVIVIHTTQGTYQSAIDWFQNSSGSQAVSAHYVISKKGEITQMVLEKDKAWHVGSENSYTIGIEHEGMMEDPNWVTEPMLDASAQLCCYLLKKWQLPATRDHVKGHVELPNQTHKDPGAYWPWDTYMAKVQACMPPNDVTGADASTQPDVAEMDAGLALRPDAFHDETALQLQLDAWTDVAAQDVATGNDVASTPPSAANGCQAGSPASARSYAVACAVLLGLWRRRRA